MYPPPGSIEYGVENRSGASTKGRFRDRKPWMNNTGPLKIEVEGLKQVFMSERYFKNVLPLGPDKNQYQGLYTTGISDCSVVAIVEFGGQGLYYFEHVAGSDIKEDVISGAAQMFYHADWDNLYAVCAQYYGGMAFDRAHFMFEMCQVPPENQIFYRSDYSGMSFGINVVEDTFGELDLWR